ncbi:MAG TPA: ABC transporter ATP-binding protein [Methylomirabilota bacterium]|nr:ABC transporter ATP-binding protein [Methylomirabilota bacterium]
MGEPAVDVQAVSKAYRIYGHPRHRLLEALWRGRRTYHQDFWALRDLTFRVEPGATFGIIGMNGSGKSTLLQIVAGIVQPTLGRVTVRGRVASLLELGAGFNHEFTGRENVVMHGAIMGFTREAMLARLPAIEAFAEIGEFIDQPVLTYSSGMFVRLAFAAAIHVDPDVLLVDEALAVGDAIFQHRCIRRIKEFQAEGKTILFVSHDIGMVKSICSAALFLHAGEARAVGDPGEVASLYHAHIANLEARRAESEPVRDDVPVRTGSVVFRPDPTFDQRAGLFRHGTGAARIRNVEILDRRQQPLPAAEFDQEVVLRVHLEFYQAVDFCILGYYFRDKTGTDVIGTNTYEENASIPARKAGDTLVVDFRQRLPLMPGTYSVTAALAYSRYSPTYFDWIDNALVLEVLPPAGGKMIHSKVWLPIEIDVHS